jgi:hypothetical protein
LPEACQCVTPCYMKNILIFLLAVLLLGCSKSDDTSATPASGMNRDTYVYMTYRNANGADLLDSSTPGHFKETDLRLYYVRDGIVDEVYDSNMDMPRNMRLESTEQGVALLVFTDEPPQAKPVAGKIVTGGAITLLKLNNTTTDTITTAWERRPGNFQVIKVWYNGELKWDRSTTPIKPLITIVKE